jgi:cytidylate kinase
VSFTVAIDGPAASGKGTISRAVASHFGFAHLDTGLLYRAVGRRVLAGEQPVAAARGLVSSDLQGEVLRDEAVGAAASKVAAIPDVREALVAFQRAFATRAGGAVLDGRDIGTVICPDAQVKLYVVAADEVRAERRWRELSGKGVRVTKAEVLADLRERDARDSARATAPLRPAADAVILDTTTMSIEAAVAAAIAAVEAKRSGA